MSIKFKTTKTKVIVIFGEKKLDVKSTFSISAIQIKIIHFSIDS